MTWLTGVLVLMVVTLCVLANYEKVTLEVRSGRDRNIFGTKGSSVKLNCTANYDLVKCGLVHVTWCRLFGETSEELTDPNKYFSTVSEDDCDDEMRCRQVVTEILSLTTADAGQFQCKAECEDSGDTAIGHIIGIKVKG